MLPRLRSPEKSGMERPNVRTFARSLSGTGDPLALKPKASNSEFDALGLNASGSPIPLRERANVLTFGLSIPLFSGDRNRGNIEAAQARGAGARQRREFLEGAIPQEIASAYRRLQTAREAVQLLSTVIGQSEANLKVIREAYTLGQLRALDVLNEQRRLVDTRLSYIDAQVEEHQAQIDLERATGGPIR